ncbi:MAG: HDIG domain-containing protein [Firmicutes bacterium]|nr:HDIG domain-containing protein [Bacillota bacterium]
MDRDVALSLVKERIKNKNLIKHMLATEAIMRHLARHFSEDENEWGLAGLLHDLDYSETYDNPGIHGLRTAEMLKDTDVSPSVIHAILAHANKVPLDGLIDKAIYATDPLTGFLVACALMTSDKKMSSTTVDFALRRFKEKAFAKGASREQMSSCKDFGFSLEDFMALGIKAMTEISDKLGL